MDELLHDHGLPDSGTSEESYFTTLQHRSDEIYDLDPSLEYFCLRRELFEARRSTMDREFDLCLRRVHLIDRITEDIEHATEHSLSYWYRDGSFCRDYCESSLHSVDRIHSNRTD